MAICSTCDAEYDDTDDLQNEIHAHYEPQSGPIRVAWMESHMPWGFFEKHMRECITSIDNRRLTRYRMKTNRTNARGE